MYVGYDAHLHCVVVCGHTERVLSVKGMSY